MRPWQVQLAAALAWLAVLPGLGCLYLAYRAFTYNDMLLIVMPVVGTAAAVAGLVLIAGGSSMALGLRRGQARARLQAVVVGACAASLGLIVLWLSPPAGVLLLGYGGTLVWLMLSPAAAADLGPFREAVPRPPAPWGSRPGSGLWAPAQAPPWQSPEVPAGPVQGPWAPDPRTLPWLSWKDHSGPRAPWWQTWQAGLAQGIPLWELVLLVVALAGCLLGLVGLPFVLAGSATLGTLHVHGGRWVPVVLLLPPCWLVVFWLERRMRTRLATRR